MNLPQVIILNGSSSSGKTSLAKALQALLPCVYLNFSMDSVLYALPPSDLAKMQTGQAINRSGYDWHKLIRGYHFALPALLQAGNHLIVDHAWCERDEKRELLTELAGYSVLLVGVSCELALATQRETQRHDRAPGLAAWEYGRVHQDMEYDITVDTSGISPQEAAEHVFDKILRGCSRNGAIATLEHLNTL